MKTNPPMPAPADADREEKARMVREAFPVCSAIAAEFEALFPGTRLCWLSEGGREIGKRGPDGVKLSETVVGPMALPKVERR